MIEHEIANVESEDKIEPKLELVIESLDETEEFSKALDGLNSGILTYSKLSKELKMNRRFALYYMKKRDEENLSYLTPQFFFLPFFDEDEEIMKKLIK